jgi:hypothetical protein
MAELPTHFFRQVRTNSLWLKIEKNFTFLLNSSHVGAVESEVWQGFHKKFLTNDAIFFILVLPREIPENTQPDIFPKAALLGLSFFIAGSSRDPGGA